MPVVTSTSRAGRLLLTEAAALTPILRVTPENAFNRPTVLPGWTVRDVIAHCAAALTRTVAKQLHAFTAQDNQRDIDARAGVPLAGIVAELDHAFTPAATVMDAASGRLNGLALGEWIHGGDIRDALELPGAYASVGVDDALALLTERSIERGLPPTTVTLTGSSTQRTLYLGGTGDPDSALDGEHATLECDAATLIRLCAGRQPDPDRFRLRGSRPEQYLLFT